MIKTIEITNKNIDEYIDILETMEDKFNSDLEKFIPKEIYNYLFIQSDTELKQVILEDRGQQWYLIKVDSNIIGFIVLLPSTKYKILTIESLYIDESYRKKGYAIQLLKELHQIIKKDKKFKYIIVRTYTNNVDAIKLYEKMKFKVWFQDMILSI